MVETYKKIEGFENYSVSDYGNVRNDKTGRILKGKNTDGYLRVSLTNNKTKQNKSIHRLVTEAFLLNPDKKQCVDHIDNDRHNNTLFNLRYATVQENNRNSSMSSKNTSGSKGVYWHKKQLRWTARITVNGKQINLGSFINKEDAINIRIQKAKDEFGEFINKCELVNN